MVTVKKKYKDKHRDEDNYQFWENIYLSDEAKWDLQGPTPIFKELAKELPIGDLCIIGCGRGYDVITFAEKGFNVTAVDFAPSAISSLELLVEKKNINANILMRDIFTLMPDYENYFDYVIEQTCFCAIHPSKRRTYEKVVSGIIKFGGHLVGLWFPLDKSLIEGGPPYATSVHEVKNIFSKKWEIVREEFSEFSIKPRNRREKLIIFKNHTS